MNSDWYFFRSLWADVERKRKRQRGVLALEKALARKDIPEFPHWVSDRSYYRFVNGLDLMASKAEHFDREDAKNTAHRLDYSGDIAGQVTDDILYWTSGLSVLAEMRDDTYIHSVY